MAETNNTHPARKQGDEIEVMEYVAKLWKKRSMIIKWGCIGVFIGLVVGFSLPKTYKASTILAPEATGNSGGSSMSGLAAMVGVSIDNNVDAISVDMFPDVAHSTPFIVGLFDLPVQFEREDTTVNTTLIDYILKYQHKPWWSHIIDAPKKALKKCISKIKGGNQQQESLSVGTRNLATLTKNERDVVSFLAENIIISVDKKTGKTLIEMEMQDPLVVYTVVQAVMDHLKDYMSNYRTSKVRQDIDNLTTIYNQRKADYYEAQQAYAHYVDANKNVILESVRIEQSRLQNEANLAYQIYNQVATQLQNARAKVQECKPAFAVVEPASVPLKHSGPSGVKTLLGVLFMALAFTVGWKLYMKDKYNELRKSFKQENTDEVNSSND